VGKLWADTFTHATAEAGNTDAMTKLGMLLAWRWDPPDLPAARSWLEKAAAAGHAMAREQLNLLPPPSDPPDPSGGTVSDSDKAG
jgi:TPR repeat protein